MESRLRDLLRCIFTTREEEIDPMAWNLQMERVAEMAANGEDIATVLPAIQQYLDNSPDCRAEFEALVLMLQAELDITDH
ncbi:MAG: hypothetical protein ACLFTK_12695 [Anaerolineales bacterium]